MPLSDAVLVALGVVLGVSGGATLMRARAQVLPEFEDRVAGSLWPRPIAWYTVEGQRLRRRGLLLQMAAVAVWLLAAAT